MGRKKGGRNADTPVKDQETLSQVISGQKTRAEVAKEMGVHEETISRRIHRAINNETIQAVIQRSIDRNAMMLGKVDREFNTILDSQDKYDKPLKVKIGEGIYKSFGVWKSEPMVNINNFIPIQIKAGDETIEIGGGAPPEASESIPQ